MGGVPLFGRPRALAHRAVATWAAKQGHTAHRPEKDCSIMQVLGLDVGTSSVKAAILEVATATPLAPIVRVSYALDHPTLDAAEVPAERLWATVAAAAREAMATGQKIEAIGLSCLTPALILLDGADQPLLPIWTHFDRRARPAARRVWAEVGEEFLATVGNRPLPGGISAVCYRQQESDQPDLRRRVKCYLHANGWLGFRLTGEKAFDPGNASFTGLYGTVTDQAWSPRWCSYFQVDPSWLPPVVCGSATLGTLRSAAAAELGAPRGYRSNSERRTPAAPCWPRGCSLVISSMSSAPRRSWRH